MPDELAAARDPEFVDSPTPDRPRVIVGWQDYGMRAVTDGDDDERVEASLSPGLQNDLKRWEETVSGLMADRLSGEPHAEALADGLGPLVDRGRELARRVASTLGATCEVMYFNELTNELEEVQPFNAWQQRTD